MALYAFNGTGNKDEVDDAKDTNVVKFRDSYNGPTFYLDGIGTGKGVITKYVGGYTGIGGTDRIEKAKNQLDHNFADNDRTIDIIGFSRGAALALQFANDIQKDKPDAEIRFLGLWDMVASFGIPGNGINVGWTLTFPNNVRKCYHAMALDEKRGGFPLTRVQSAKGNLPIAGRVEEVWFRGVHSDVGGSSSIGLGSIALCWMLRRAKENGLPIAEERILTYQGLCNPDAPISENWDPKIDSARNIAPGDTIHETVKPRGYMGGREHNDPPPNLALAIAYG